MPAPQSICSVELSCPLAALMRSPKRCRAKATASRSRASTPGSVSIAGRKISPDMETFWPSGLMKALATLTSQDTSLARRNARVRSSSEWRGQQLGSSTATKTSSSLSRGMTKVSPF